MNRTNLLIIGAIALAFVIWAYQRHVECGRLYPPDRNVSYAEPCGGSAGVTRIQMPFEITGHP
jgi:hypothetical protein